MSARAPAPVLRSRPGLAGAKGILVMVLVLAAILGATSRTGANPPAEAPELRTPAGTPDGGAAGSGGSGGAADDAGGAAGSAGEGGAASAEVASEPSAETPESLGAPQALPAVEADPAILPAVEPQAERPRERKVEPIAPEQRPRTLLKTILGLLGLLALAYAGGHPRVLQWEERLGISQVITTGFPFVLLGMFARLPAVGIVTDDVVREMSPLLRLGLGFIGLNAGFRLDTRLFQSAPQGTATLALLSTVMPGAIVVAAIAPVLLLFSGELSGAGLRDPVFMRDALILGTAGAMTARSAVRRVEPGTAADVIRLEAAAGIVGVATVASFFRPSSSDVTWHLPAVGWLLITLGLGTAIGLLFYAVLQTTRQTPEFLVVTLGWLAFAAGGAAYLHLSSIAVAFVSGVMLANFPGKYHDQLRELLQRIDRPILLLSLFVIGAVWQVGDWRGWALMPLFAIARLAGKWLAATAAAFHPRLPLSPEAARTLTISPIGALAIAIVVNAQLLYPGGTISLIVSAVIGGGVLTEMFVQLATRRQSRREGRARVLESDLQPAPESSPKDGGT